MEDGRRRLSSTLPLARTLSIAGHPFLLIPLMVAVATRNWRWSAAVAAGTILPLLAIALRNVRRGHWSDADVSRPDQRSGLYRAAFPLLALSTLILYFLGAGPSMMRGMAAAAVMMGIGWAATPYLKISLHLMCAAYCAAVLIRLYPCSALILLPLLPALAWSRHHLDRHTWTELVVGAVVGGAAGVVAGV
jgi:hypothetical protein